MGAVLNPVALLGRNEVVEICRYDDQPERFPVEVIVAGTAEWNCIRFVFNSTEGDEASLAKLCELVARPWNYMRNVDWSRRAMPAARSVVLLDLVLRALPEAARWCRGR